MMKKSTKFEGSPADEKMDAKMARKAKMSMKQWEKSAKDKKMDAKGQKALDKRK